MISWALQRGVSLFAVRRSVGHETGSMTARSGHLAGSHLADAELVLDQPVVTPVDTWPKTSENAEVVSA